MINVKTLLLLFITEILAEIIAEIVTEILFKYL